MPPLPTSKGAPTPMPTSSNPMAPHITRTAPCIHQCHTRQNNPPLTVTIKRDSTQTELPPLAPTLTPMMAPNQEPQKVTLHYVIDTAPLLSRSTEHINNPPIHGQSVLRHSVHVQPLLRPSNPPCNRRIYHKIKETCLRPTVETHLGARLWQRIRQPCPGDDATNTERVTEILKYILWVYETKLRLHFPHNGGEYRPAGVKPRGEIPPIAQESKYNI